MSSYRNTKVDVVISDKPCILYAINLIYSGTNEATIKVYDGIDANSGRLIATLYCVTKGSSMIDMHGVECERGIYIDIVERVEEVTVFYDVLSNTPNPPLV